MEINIWLSMQYNSKFKKIQCYFVVPNVSMCHLYCIDYCLFVKLKFTTFIFFKCQENSSENTVEHFFCIPSIISKFISWGIFDWLYRKKGTFWPYFSYSLNHPSSIVQQLLFWSYYFQSSKIYKSFQVIKKSKWFSKWIM